MDKNIEVNELIREIENIFIEKVVLSNKKPYFGDIEIKFNFNAGKEVHISKRETFLPRKL